MTQGTDVTQTQSVVGGKAPSNRAMNPEEFEVFWAELEAEVAAEESGLTDDAAEAEEEIELTFEEKVAKVRALVVEGKSSHREILRKILVFCDSLQELSVIEREVESYPEYSHAAQNPYRLLVYLEDAYGVERFNLDEEGAVLTEERTEGLTEDEIDDLIFSYGFQTTEAGRKVAEEITPSKRMDDLFANTPDRVQAYSDLLDFCKIPRSFPAIEQFFTGYDLSAIKSLNLGSSVTVKPSALVDKLEKAGALVWKDGWVMTSEGKAYLETLVKVRS